LPEKKDTAVTAQVAAGKVGLHPAGTQVMKKKRLIDFGHVSRL
jgi:hypothetical protein